MENPIADMHIILSLHNADNNIRNSPTKFSVPGKLIFPSINIRKSTENIGMQCTIPV